jgi:hypothetical protein
MPPRYIAVPFLSNPVLPIPTPGMTAVVVNGTQINLAVQYAGPPGATSYSFERATNINGPFLSRASGTSSTFPDTGLSSSTTYFYRARVQVTDGRFSDYSPIKSGTTLAQVPNATTGVDAQTTGQTTIQVIWNAVTSTPLSGYHVYRGGTLVSTQTSTTFNDSGLTPNTNYTYVVAAFNAAGEGTSGTDTAKTNPTVAPGSLNNNYGLYPSFYYSGGVSAGHFNNSDKAIIAQSASVPQIQGFHAQIYWRTCDTGASAAVYDWTVMDLYLNACKAAGKQFWPCLAEATITASGSVASGFKVVPTWVYNSLGGLQFAQLDYSNGGCVSKRSSAPLMDRWIAFLKAFVARYDGNPNMEGFTIYEESALAVNSGGGAVTTTNPGGDYSDSACQTQIFRMVDAVRDPAQINCQRMQVCLGCNYWLKSSDTSANWVTVMKKCIDNKVGLQGPDTWISSWVCPNTPLANINYPQQNVNGTHTNTSFNRNITSDSAYRGWYGNEDFRGKITWFPRTEVTDLGGYITKAMNPVPTPADVYLTRTTYDKPQYFSFDVITPESGYTGNGTGAFPGAGPDQKWSSGGLPFVQSLPVNVWNPTDPSWTY